MKKWCRRLISALEGQSLKYETYFKLVLATGMRRGEACGLRWSDINWKKRSIHIQRNVVKLSREPIFVKPPKTPAVTGWCMLSEGDGQIVEVVEAAMRVGSQTER